MFAKNDNIYVFDDFSSILFRFLRQGPNKQIFRIRSSLGENLLSINLNN